MVSLIHLLNALSHIDNCLHFFLIHWGDNSLKRGNEPRLVQASRLHGGFYGHVALISSDSYLLCEGIIKSLLALIYLAW